MITTQRDLRAVFWQWLADERPDLYAMRRAGGQNSQNCEIRELWCLFIDTYSRNGVISSKLAGRAVL